MSNLIEQIMKMSEGIGGDAIILQLKKVGANGAPDYDNADAIIRLMRTAGGIQWALHSLSPSRDFPVASAGVYGDVNDIVREAERRFGVTSDVREWVSVSYRDPDFPPNLIR